MPSSADEQQRGEAEAQLTASLSGAKRKEPERRKPSFKVIGHLVLAMRRFSDSINPTYTYGKRTSSSSGGGPKLNTEDAGVAVSSGEKRLDQPPSLGRTASPALVGPDNPKYAYSSRGHKFDFLIKPLPATEDEEAPAALPPSA